MPSYSRRAKGRILAVCNSWRNTEDGGIDKQGVYFNLCKAPKATRIDAAAVTRMQIAAGVDIELIHDTAGDPGVAHLFGDEFPGFPVNLLPLFMADDDMYVDVVFPVGSILISDDIDPLETLLSISPVSLVLIRFLVKTETLKLLPDRGKRSAFQNDHEIPVVCPATLHDRPVCIASFFWLPFMATG